jgi:hypothetical protein
VAERERLTNKERKALAREERKRKEAEAARQRKRAQLRNGVITFAVVAVVAAVVLQAFLPDGTDLEDAILVSSSEAEVARVAAGCELLVDREPLPDRSHFDNDAAPDPDTIYGEVRPTHSGPHTIGVHPVLPAADRQLDEVSLTHNLEHGTVIVWWDPEQVDGATAGSIGNWAQVLNANGFRRDVGGIGIVTAPYEEPGINSGKAVAFRAWGTAMDCDTWDETVAHAFVIEHFGTHGIAPERLSAPFPTDVLAFDDIEVEDTSTDEAPIDVRTPPEEMEEIDPDDVDGDGVPDEDQAEDATDDGSDPADDGATDPADDGEGTDDASGGEGTEEG